VADYAVRELKTQIKEQVYADGCSFEASTCYHRLSLETFFYSALICVNAAEPTGADYSCTAEKIFGADYVGRLRSMFDACCTLPSLTAGCRR